METATWQREDEMFFDASYYVGLGALKSAFEGTKIIAVTNDGGLEILSPQQAEDVVAQTGPCADGKKYLCWTLREIAGNSEDDLLTSVARELEAEHDHNYGYDY